MYLTIIFALATSIYAQEESATKYLESAIADLKNLNSNQQSRRKIDDLPISRRSHKPTVPTLALTKFDLSRIYEAAVGKGDATLLDSDSGSQMQAAVYEIADDKKTPPLDRDKDVSGYYYYYYPLKSFADEHYPEPEHQNVYPVDPYHHDTITANPNMHQYHTHKHEHNVLITASKHKIEEQKKNKALEPLFMAISGFIGMAVMFIVSVLVLPKIGVLKARGSKEPVPEVTNVLKVIFQAIEGQDCSERFACELGKTAKAFNIHNNRFVKLIRRIAPASIGKRLFDIDKFANKKYKCALISCKKKTRPTEKLSAKQKTHGKS